MHMGHALSRSLAILYRYVACRGIINALQGPRRQLYRAEQICDFMGAELIDMLDATKRADENVAW